MYRIAQRSIVRRQFSPTVKRLNDVKPKTVVNPVTPPPVAPKVVVEPVSPITPKKSRPFRKFFIRVGLFTTVVYAAGIAASLKNDTVYDTFVEYFPLGEELIELTENAIISYNASRAPASKAAVASELPSINDRFDKTVPVTKSGIVSTKIDESELKKIEEVKEQVVQNAIDNTVPANAVEFSLPLIKFKSSDEKLNKTIASLNDIIKSINHKSPVHASLIIEISNDIKDLNAKLTSVTSDHEKSVQDLGSKEQASLVATQEKEVELTKNFIKQLDLERELLEKKYHDNLINEIEATKSKIFLQADNKIDSIKLQQLNEFNRIISDKVDTERNGKLAKLDAVIERIAKLEEIESDMSNHLSNFAILKNLKTEISKITVSLSESTRPIILNDQFDTLSRLAKELNDDLLIESIKQLPKDGNLLTKQQIITRWKLLVPELKSASLLPPNAGILGHFASRVLSKFMFSKEGFAEGNDIESIISRVNGYLERDELDLAVEQVTNLKGWTRKLANDWVIESRKRLEVEFLINVIDYETRLLA